LQTLENWTKFLKPFNSRLMKFFWILLLGLLLIACETSKDEPTDASEETSLYFPPLNTEEWQRASPGDLGWNPSALDELLSFLEDNNTRAFIVLKDGKIVIENYFGNNILNTSAFDQNTRWYWASAGKTLTASLVGIAQTEGFLNLDDPSSDYLGNGWTSLPAEKEALIQIKNQLSMTTGLEYDVDDLNCTLPSCLTYNTDASEQWYYHNAPYTLLEKVVENATGVDYNTYTDQKIESTLGMNGEWISQGFNQVYWSTARDMARFGLLMLNQGRWEDTDVLSDNSYYDLMLNSSQSLNPSYGYLWWLNGKESIIIPDLPNSFNSSLSENAPADLMAGMGKNGQFVEVIPSKNLVVIRMGEAPEASLVPLAFHDEMWGKINQVID